MNVVQTKFSNQKNKPLCHAVNQIIELMMVQAAVIYLFSAEFITHNELNVNTQSALADNCLHYTSTLVKSEYFSVLSDNHIQKTSKNPFKSK